MRPYLAVIRDSFREAMDSRILWILLALITLLLLLLAPLGYREQLSSRLSEDSVRDWPAMIEKIKVEGPADQPSPSRRIWTLLNESLRRKLAKFAMPKEGDISGAFEMIEVMREFRQQLNELLRRRDFYSEADWKQTQLLGAEIKELLAASPDELRDDEIGRRNLLLVEAAYPELTRVSPPTSLKFRYLVFSVGEAVPIRRQILTTSLESIIASLMRWLLGVLGVFVAVLVTAPIVPQTFEPGSIHLLLSKPISRWMLLLAKYCGGCTFILIAATYLITGLWLILGVRFGIWEFRLLLGIPIYMFMFAIFFAVSAFAGLVWRNTLVAIVITILFWAACFLVGSSKVLLEGFLQKYRVERIIQARDTLITVDEMGLASQWNEDEGNWQGIYESDEQNQLRPAFAMMLNGVPRQMKPMGIVYDPRGDRLLSVQRSFRTGRRTVQVGKRSQQWQSNSGAAAPAGSLDLLVEPRGTVLAISSLGIYRLRGDPETSSEPLKVLGVSIPLSGGGPFRSVGPEPAVILTTPAAATINPDNGHLALFSRGKLTLLAADGQDGQDRGFRLAAERELDVDQRQPVLLAYGGSTAIVGREDGSITILDADTLDQRQRMQPMGNNQPRILRAAPGGRWFAVLFHTGHLWLYDAQEQHIARARVAGQGEISAVEFANSGEMLVASRGSSARVSRYRLPSLELERQYVRKLGFFETAYRYAITPVYTVFPKPGELYKTIQYLLSGKDTTATGESREDLSVAQRQLRPWAPVWSGLAFTFVVLALACVYIERQEY